MTYWYWKETFGATFVGKDVMFMQFWGWVVVAFVILIDWIILLTGAISNKKEQLYLSCG
jgi:hypothetical protein